MRSISLRRRLIFSATLVLVNPDAPVQPGDRLLLHDGDHGQCTLMDAHNPDYLLIAAAPGAGLTGAAISRASSSDPPSALAGIT